MEIRIMRKYFFGTILVLTALAACNKEVDTPVSDNGQEEATPGKVTLTFTAAISDETRTEYPDDKTAGWVIGDKISVCVTDTDNTDYKIAEFEATSATDTGMEFTGEVESGYTTIVSGVYPANDNHVFSDGSVQSVYLPDTYELGTANDNGIALPMVGEMDENENFVFHHICGALKIEVIDIFNALTFTTAETITGNFELNSEGRIEIPSTNGDGSTVTFNYGRLSTNPAVGERNNRTFYIPVPDGTLATGAVMELKNSSGVTVYEKTTPQAINISNKIVRLSPIELKTPSGWSNIITEADSGSKGSYTIHIPSGSSFFYVFILKSSFEANYHGSIAELIEKRVLTATSYIKSTKFTMSNPIDNYFDKEYVLISCGLNTVNETRQMTFDCCYLEWAFEEPTQEYLFWIGEWTVTDSKSTPNVDTWTISRKQANHTYSVSGLNENSITALALYDATNNRIVFQSQYVGKSTSFDYYLFGSGSTATYAVKQTETPYDLMYVEKSGSEILLKGFVLPDNNECIRYYRMNFNRETEGWSYNYARYLPTTLTRVTE